MNDDMTRLLLERAAQQRGLVTRSDLTDLHVTRHQRARLVRIGSLVPVGRRTFELGGLPADSRRRLLAACLDAGGVASHRSAAWLHGLSGFQPGLAPEVMVERLGSEYRVPCAQVHTTTWLPSDDLVVVDGLPATSVARTLLSLASLVPQIPLDQVRGAVDEAVRDRKASDAWLWWRLERLRRRGRPGLTVLGSILAARAGGEVTESWLEREFLRILAGAGVALPACQLRLEREGAFVARVDFTYPGTPILIEVTGAVGHSAPAQRAADARRRNRLSALRPYLLEFTYEQVVGEPAAVVAEVVHALAEVGDPARRDRSA